MFATLALFGSCVNMLSPLAKDFVEGFMPPGSSPFEVLTQNPWLWYGYQGLYGLCAIVLLAAAVMLLRRRALCAPVFIAWALLRIPTSCLGVFYTYVAQRAQVEAMKKNPQGPPVAAAAASLATDLLSNAVLVGIGVWWLAQVAFVLWWFSRRKVKADLARWFQHA
ncbi:hypothetical protein PHYC_03002 [Phycisphaerales bacterium]|nr:hypothetical protein PHYC_03002 [Phycisphaerales bacterium]